MNQSYMEILTYFVLSVLMTVIAFSINLAAGCILMLSSLFFFVAYGIFSHLRTRKIRKLAENLEKILHGQDVLLSIESSNEGALSILESEIRKMTGKLKEQSEQLKRDKIKLQEAITDIFHQIRTPLTAMSIAASRLTKEDIPYETRILLLRDIKKQIERSRWLTESLLKMSKIDAGTAKFRQETVNTGEMIEKATSSLLIPMELAEIDLVIDVRNETFTGDLDWTAEAISNLVKNAIEHFILFSNIDGQNEKSETAQSSGNHHCKMSPEYDENDRHPDAVQRENNTGNQSPNIKKWIKISAQETPLYTQIKVEDNGGGFEKADIPKLFERYFKGKNAGADSIGVGLALSRMIIGSQNGSIKAYNTADGACFSIKFYKSII